LKYVLCEVMFPYCLHKPLLSSVQRCKIEQCWSGKFFCNIKRKSTFPLNLFPHSVWEKTENFSARGFPICLHSPLIICSHSCATHHRSISEVVCIYCQYILYTYMIIWKVVCMHSLVLHGLVDFLFWNYLVLWTDDIMAKLALHALLPF